MGKAMGFRSAQPILRLCAFLLLTCSWNIFRTNIHVVRPHDAQMRVVSLPGAQRMGRVWRVAPGGVYPHGRTSRGDRPHPS
jgi:hypothetical protein